MVEVETQCNGNSLEPTRVTLVKTPRNKAYRTWTSHLLCSNKGHRTCTGNFLCSNKGYRTWNGHLLCPGKVSSRGIRATTQSQNLQPTISPACKLCWGKGGTELLVVTNQRLVQLNTQTMRGSLLHSWVYLDGHEQLRHRSCCHGRYIPVVHGEAETILSCLGHKTSVLCQYQLFSMSDSSGWTGYTSGFPVFTGLRKDSGLSQVSLPLQIVF